ncbi:DUF4157 domain-containing protein [Hymenobacter sp. BT662]|uniref:DUF4157 domain-containing protein n=2 Tax=Hymenobacter ruricola TaxID=2791023 RepID=A0ABS0I233_9BACT|nr:DUF4157 domain-containing protein [Hymenobacter ruricola]
MMAQSPRMLQAAQLRAAATPAPVQREEAPAPVQENNTGLPDELKAGVENLSGHSLDDVQVHYNSAKPAELQAHAYAQGREIHVAPGQEQHLPHEAWHVAQQKQGRVRPTRQLKGQVPVNDDAGLEKEADVMGAKALGGAGPATQLKVRATATTGPVQRKAVVQRREIGEVDAALQVVLADLNTIGPIDVNSAVGTITDRQTRLAAFPARIAPLAVEVKDKGGNEVTPLADLDDKVAEITRDEPTLAASIAAGEAPAPAKPASAWGAGRGEHARWKADNDNLEANRAKRDSNHLEKTRLTNERPLSVLKNTLNDTEDRLAALVANLKEAEKQRYFQLLMTTQTPAVNRYEPEKPWMSGPSTLGIFIFSGPPVIQGIPGAGVGPIEVHIHFRGGTKQVNKAHIKYGWKYAGTDLRPGSPPYAATALAACKAQITTVK